MQENCQAHKNCHVAKTLKILSSKWTMLILHNLCEGTKRFGQLQRTLEGISPKTLSERLMVLEKEKYINKKIYAEVPLHVEYSLTSKGQKLKRLFTSIEEL